jgi:hypothetical protein
MLSVGLIALVEQLATQGVKLLLFGDWNQLPPVCNLWRTTPIEDERFFERSRLLWHWAGGTCFHLTVCRRADQEHFDFCNRFQQMPLWQAKAACRERYHRRDARRPALALVLSHRRRRSINEERQKQLVASLPADAPRACIEGSHEEPFDLVAGTPLIGCLTRHGVINGVFYRVTRLVDDEVAEVQVDGGDSMELRLSHLAKATRLAWAITVHASQSREFVGLVEVYDLDHPYFTMRHLVVSTSRVKAGSNLVIV